MMATDPALAAHMGMGAAVGGPPRGGGVILGASHPDDGGYGDDDDDGYEVSRGGGGGRPRRQGGGGRSMAKSGSGAGGGAGSGRKKGGSSRKNRTFLPEELDRMGQANERLLGKMTAISMRPSKWEAGPGANAGRRRKGPSSHTINRRRAEDKLRAENMKIMNRLQGVKSEFDRTKMKKDARKQKKLAKSMSSVRAGRNRPIDLPEWQ